MPKISVVTPFHNRIEWTINAIESVLNQTFQDFEIILVNDGSTESLDDIVAINDPRIQILHQDNRGPAAARNHGMRAARGEYIAFLDSDDLFVPDKLMYQFNHFLNNPDAWLSHTSYRYFDADGYGEVVHSGKYGGTVYPDIFAGCPICMSTVMIKRIVVDNGIFLDERYRVSEDIIFFSLVAMSSERILGIDIPFTLFRKTNSTHAFSSQAQIIGSKNIIHFLRNSEVKLTGFQQKTVFFQIYSYMSDHCFLLHQPYNGYVYGLISFWYRTNKVSYLIQRIEILGKKAFFKTKTFLFKTKTFLFKIKQGFQRYNK